MACKLVKQLIRACKRYDPRAILSFILGTFLASCIGNESDLKSKTGINVLYKGASP